MTEIDAIDERILFELERDGRISNIDLAQKIALSPSACSRRVQELERMGVIKGYKAILDRDILERGFVVYTTIGLSRHLTEDQKAFERVISLAKEVKECYNMTGSIEYILRVEVKDLTAYKNFHNDVLGTIPQVSSITSYIVMDTIKE